MFETLVYAYILVGIVRTVTDLERPALRSWAWELSSKKVGNLIAMLFIVSAFWPVFFFASWFKKAPPPNPNPEPQELPVLKSGCKENQKVVLSLPPTVADKVITMTERTGEDWGNVVSSSVAMYDMMTYEWQLGSNFFIQNVQGDIYEILIKCKTVEEPNEDSNDSN